MKIEIDFCLKEKLIKNLCLFRLRFYYRHHQYSYSVFGNIKYGSKAK